MKTAVEYLVEQLIPKALSVEQYYHIRKAKEMEKQQMIEMHDKGFDSVKQLNDDYAIEFYKWMGLDETEDLIYSLRNKGDIYYDPTYEELLEIFKKEKGL
jgi:hypothetical protein